MEVYLQIESLTKSYGDLLLFDALSLGINEGDRIGLIAKNGTGKTTLLNIITGAESPDSGRVTFRRDLRIAYLSQDPNFPPECTVLEACFHSDSEVVRVIADYEYCMSSGDHSRLDAILDQMDLLKAWDYEQRAKQILSQLKINRFDQRIDQLSGGQLKRVALANVLISDPQLLFLDEPTNHLDVEMTEWLEEYLRRNNISLLMVTHDRYFLDRVCNTIVEIDNRNLYTYRGNYSYYLEKRQERVEAQATEMDRATNLYKHELEWMRRQPQARATKAKSRKEGFYALEQQVKSVRDEGNMKLGSASTYIGSKIFEMKHVAKSYGTLHLLRDFSYTFSRYEKLGIIGKNGTGKSTFIKMLLGEVLPDGGTIDVGETIRWGYYSQSGLQFDDSMKVIDVVRNIAEEITFGDGKRLTASQFLNYFLFPPEKQHNFVAKLSGGERRRLYLCTVLINNPNFLVLDEPTNDLDIITLNVLEEYLAAFKGCVIVVSHDRYFMDKVVDHLLVFLGEGNVREFPGNYTDYRDVEREATEQLAAATAKPSQPKAIVQKRSTDISAAKRKLSYNEQRELEEIDQSIPGIEAEKADLEKKMSTGVLSSEALLTASLRIAALIDELDKKTLRWLELSDV